MLEKRELLFIVEEVTKQFDHFLPVVTIIQDLPEEVKAVAIWDGEKEQIVFNQNILNLEVDYIIDIVRHEILHLVTKLQDESVIFQELCKKLGIPLTEE